MLEASDRHFLQGALTDLDCADTYDLAFCCYKLTLNLKDTKNIVRAKRFSI